MRRLKPTEEDIMKQITDGLSLHGIEHFRVAERIPGMSKRLSTPGIPDLVGWVSSSQSDGLTCLDDHALPLFIEVKRPGGKRRPAQETFIQRAKSDGCIAFFAQGWEDVAANLGAHGVKVGS